MYCLAMRSLDKLGLAEPSTAGQRKAWYNHSTAIIQPTTTTNNMMHTQTTVAVAYIPSATRGGVGVLEAPTPETPACSEAGISCLLFTSHLS